MKFKMLLSTAVAVCIFPALSSAAPANENPAKGKAERPTPGAMFNQIDADGDGRLSRDEVNASSAKRLQRNFDAIDTDGDGYLSREEMRTFHQAMRTKMQERRGSAENTRAERGENLRNRGEAPPSMEERKARRAARQAEKED